MFLVKMIQQTGITILYTFREVSFDTRPTYNVNNLADKEKALLQKEEKSIVEKRK